MTVGGEGLAQSLRAEADDDTQVEANVFRLASLHWKQIASFGYECFLNLGRGTVCLDVRQREVVNQQAEGLLPLKYLRIDNQSLNDFIGEETKALLREYDPEDELVFLLQRAGGVYVFLLGMAYLQAPQQVYFEQLSCASQIQ